MHPRLSIIAAAIRKIGTAIEPLPTTDPYWDNVVLSLRMESSDPYYNQVVLGMHMDDVGLTDVKGKSGTLTGNVARSATQSKFGGYSAYFDGTGDYISFADHADFYLGNTFTIEAWIYCNSFADENIVCSQTNSGSYGELYFGVDKFGSVYILTNNGSWVYTYGPAPITINTWYHIAVTCNSGITKVFVNGIHGSAGTFTNWPDRSVNFIVGASLNPGAGSYNYTNGYIDDLRITKGVARYTKNFSIPTAAFQEPVNTAIDDKGNTITTNGNAQYSGTSKYGDGSFYFDGTGDYLSIPTSTNFNFGTDDFTIECWVNLTNYTSERTIICSYVTWDSNVDFNLYVTASTGIVRFAAGDGVPMLLVSDSAIATGQFVHIAICRSSGTTRMFINGIVQTSTYSSSLNIQNDATTIRIGCDSVGTSGFLGYIDEFRITKGVARYTSNFTPYKILTSAPTGDPWYNYTALLLKMNGTNGSTTFTDESYSPKTMTVFGNSNLSTSQKKYGTAAGYFDGSGDYLRTPYNAGFDPGATGDYTAECWIYPTNVTSLRAIFGPYSNPSVTHGWILYQGASGEIAVTTRDLAGAFGGVVTAANTLKINQWQHIAWTKTGKVNRLWHNGVKVAEATDTLDLYVNPSFGFIIGRWDDSGTTGCDFIGYMDDVRLTKGVARYTANFLPPGPHIAAIDPDTDQWWLNTVLAIRADGTQGSTAFTDLKGKTLSGDMTVTNAISKFGQSAYSDSSKYIGTVTSTDFDFGTGNFTIEFWLYPTALTGAGEYPSLISRSSGAGALTQWILGLSPNGLGMSFNVMQSNGSWTNCGPSYTGALSANTWYHIALVRIGTGATDIKLFVNGSLVASSTSNPNTEVNNASKPINVYTGKSGYIDDVRITKGIARYTSAFTPSEKPIPTYLIGPDHDQYWDKVVFANSFDSSLNDIRTKVATGYGGIALSTSIKKFGNSSVYFDGVNDYLTYPYSSDFNFGAGDFTLETWIYPTAFGTLQAVFDKYDATAYSWQAAISTTGAINFYLRDGAGTGSVINYNTNAKLVLNTWNHVAWVRSGNTLYMYLDGVLVGSVGINYTLSAANLPFTIGRQGNSASNFLSGYLDDVRITKGVARYTANFALPTVANILG